jgi:hypothetical protein
MAAHTFALQPFEGEGDPRWGGVRLEGSLERQAALLQVRIVLHGDSSGPEAAVVWPGAGPAPRRRDGLWQHSCLEWFVAAPEQERYWEFNLSPGGDWNVYQLEGYRRGLQPDPQYDALPFRTITSRHGIGVELSCPLPAAVAQLQPLQLAVTAVLQHREGGLSYWALHHGGPEPDFHRRDGFRLRI